MKLDKWNPYLKLFDDGTPCMAQQTYEPLVSLDGKTFCMNYSFPNHYQYMETSDRPFYTDEVVDWFFNNELKYIEMFKHKPYAPEVIDIDYVNRRIYLKWYNQSCNEIIYSGGEWPRKQWLTQIKNIMLDQYKEGVYKLTMYPHCHYIDDNNNMRAIDWYGSVPVDTPHIEERYMQGIISDTSRFRLAETGLAVDNVLNLEIMFKRSLSTHVAWGDQSMNDIYKEVFSD